MAMIRSAAVCFLLMLSLSTVLAGDREDCIQEQDKALAARACALYAARLAREKQPDAIPPGATAAPQDAAAGGFLAQDWRLNPTVSRLNMTTVKGNMVTETHSFSGLDGTISPAGEARITIDLSSVATGVDIRDVRMRFLLFETFKFPSATVTTRLDKAALQGLLASPAVTYPLTFMLDLHGVKKEVAAQVAVSRTGTSAVSVKSVSPITIQAEDFALTAGIAKLSEAVNGVKIVPTVAIAFDLAFEGSRQNPQLDAIRAAAASVQAQDRARGLTLAECQTRMEVISSTRHIYFMTGSAEIDAKESAPLLDEVAQFTNRCPQVKMEISGHTDMTSSSSTDFNQKLSEQRAGAVAEALTQRGVSATGISTVGYGYSRPVADNNSEAGRAKNRRIEFHGAGAR